MKIINNKIIFLLITIPCLLLAFEVAYFLYNQDFNRQIVFACLLIALAIQLSVYYFVKSTYKKIASQNSVVFTIFTLYTFNITLFYLLSNLIIFLIKNTL